MIFITPVFFFSDFLIGGHNYNEEDLHKPLMLDNAARNRYGFYGDINQIVDFEPQLIPRKGHEFDEFEVGIDYERFTSLDHEHHVPKCLVMQRTINGIKTFIYGWIDEAQPVTSARNNNTRIKWHIDWWLTWADFMQNKRRSPLEYGVRSAEPAAGRVIKGPENIARPSGIVPRRWLQESAQGLNLTLENPNTPWVIVAYTINNTINEKVQTTLTYINWQPGVSITSGSDTGRGPGWDDIFEGKIEECFGLDPNAVIGAWLSPMPASQSDAIFHTYDNQTYAAYKYFNSGSTVTTSWPAAEGDDVRTSDMEKWVITDPTGTEIFTAPWGLPFSKIYMQVDVGSSGANVIFYLADNEELEATENNWQRFSKAGEGRLFSFPLPALPITENAWQSYNYSGERAYDIQMREIQRNQNLLNGVMGSTNSAIGGAVAGSMAAPGVGTIAGAAAGLITGLTSAGVNYFMSGAFDYQTQQAVDKLTANQAAGLIITAKGRRGLEPMGKAKNTGAYGWSLLKMVADPQSKAEYDMEHMELGWDTDTYCTDCSSFIMAGGPLRIQNLIMHGDLPKEGREYIRQLFERGVHIDLINE